MSPMHAGHVFLQAGQIIQAWWFPILSLTLDFGDGHAHARHVHDVEQMPCPGLLVDALAGQMPAPMSRMIFQNGVGRWLSICRSRRTIMPRVGVWTRPTVKRRP